MLRSMGIKGLMLGCAVFQNTNKSINTHAVLLPHLTLLGQINGKLMFGNHQNNN